MNRLATRESLPALHEAMRLIPGPIHRLIACDLLLGFDPIRAGLHPFDDTGDGRSNRDTAHVAYPWNQTTLDSGARRTTMVIPVEETPECFVHEFGHVLDESLGFSWWVPAISEYAKTNRHEAFACAFTAFVLPQTVNADRPLSEEEWLLFDSICRGNQPT